MASSLFVLFSVWLLARVATSNLWDSSERGSKSWSSINNCHASVVLIGRGTGSLIQDRVVGLGGPGDILSRKIIQSVLPFYAPEVSSSLKPNGPSGLSRSRDGFVYEIYNPMYRAILFRIGILDTVVLPLDRAFLEAAGNEYGKKVMLVSGSITNGVVATGGSKDKLIRIGSSYVAAYLQRHANQGERLFCR
ncbi:MAG: hypothetical protein ACKO8I_12080 [Cyanobacteriota bacterium]